MPRLHAPWALLLCAAAQAQGVFTNYESPVNRPLAVSADGLRLLVLDVPAASVGLWSLAEPALPRLLREIPVGLEPVAVAWRSADEAWVVDWLSDAIAVVSLAQGRVVATIPVGDEPMDIVFAGTPPRAFVSVATSRAVQVVDPDTRAVVATIPIPGEQPRCLATDGARVWVAAHRSGNQTTVVPAHLAPPQPPPTNPNLPPPPRTSLIVASTDPQWREVLGVDLPDRDVFEIHPRELLVTRSFAHVGTTLFGLTPDPRDGSLWVANTEARNRVRFEPVVRGHTIDSRVTRIAPGGGTTVFDLNPGVDYTILPNPAARAIALSQPVALQFEPGGERLFVAAFGSDRLGVLDRSGAVQARVDLAPGVTSPRDKRGPRGLQFHPGGRWLYVLNRLSNALAVVDVAALQLVREIALFDPTPPRIKQGRGFLYDSKLSGNGTNACASCHVDGDLDGLAWDLGDPGGVMDTAQGSPVHPMKGPMVTQSMKGLGFTEPFHWRGDRMDLGAFNGAFRSLMGGSELGQDDLFLFVEFGTTIDYPPNPHERLDRTMPTEPAGESAADGMRLFLFSRFRRDRDMKCQDCHALPETTAGVVFPAATLELEQPFKGVQLRNVYQKTGRIPGAGGARLSGFGVSHDGAFDSVFEFLRKPFFGELANQPQNLRALERFVLAIDTGTAPAVGHARTVDRAAATDPRVREELDVLMFQVEQFHAQLIAKGELRGEPTGLAVDRNSMRFVPDRAALPSFTLGELLAEIAAGRAALTFIGTPFVDGLRLGIDRDQDGILDGDARPARYGAATNGCGVDLAANGAPLSGNEQFALVCQAPVPAARFLALLGFAPTDLGLLGLRVLVDPVGALVLEAGADALGVAVLPLPIPNDPQLAGAVLFAQAFATTRCGPQGVAASAGLRLELR